MFDVHFLKRLVILNGFVPLLLLVYDGGRDQLGSNPVNHALHITGILSLIFLLLSLVITPLRRLTGWNGLLIHRRALGLFAFLYGVVHFAIYVVGDRELNLSSALSEIASRRFLQFGGIALLLMVPLAITSTNYMIRKVGSKRWKLLHRLTYPLAILGVAHYYMLVKSDVRIPVQFAILLAVLLGLRIYHHYADLRIAATKVASKQIAKG